jgi:hypothetical protein
MFLQLTGDKQYLTELYNLSLAYSIRQRRVLDKSCILINYGPDKDSLVLFYEHEEAGQGPFNSIVKALGDQAGTVKIKCRSFEFMKIYDDKDAKYLDDTDLDS